MSIKVCAMSDLHGYLPEIPKCDILLLAGDLCPVSDHHMLRQSEWLDTEFRAWLESRPEVCVFATWGNHDFVGERSQLVPDLPWTLLVDREAKYKGLRIYGTPWTPLFGRWAFMRDDENLPFESIPEGLDILISHGPPYGFGDEVYEGEHVGSRKLLQRLLVARPKLTVFGHIHEGRGEKMFDGMILANVTVVDGAYNLTYPAWEIQI